MAIIYLLYMYIYNKRTEKTIQINLREKSSECYWSTNMNEEKGGNKRR